MLSQSTAARIWGAGSQVRQWARHWFGAAAPAEGAVAAEPVAIELSITPGRVATTLTGILAVLFAANVAGVVATHVLGHEFVFGFVPQFNFDQEGNIPTWFNSMLLLSSGLLLAAIATAKRRQRDAFALHWMGLSAIFLFLSLDEATSIHELLMYNFSESLNVGGAFHFVWVLFYVPLALAIGFLYLRFLAALPRRTMLLFMVAGALYVGGAAGMEMVGGMQAEAHGEANLTYALITSTEELLEMSGVILFIYALLGYARRSGAGSRLVLRPGGVEGPA
jgi:hypothetical protein